MQSNVTAFPEENPTQPAIRARLERLTAKVDDALCEVERSMYSTLQECSEELDEILGDLEADK